MEEQTRNHIAMKNTSFYRTRLESCWVCCAQYDVTLITASMSRQDNLWTYVSCWAYSIWVCVWFASRAHCEAVRVAEFERQRPGLIKHTRISLHQTLALKQTVGQWRSTASQCQPQSAAGMTVSLLETGKLIGQHLSS